MIMVLLWDVPPRLYPQPGACSACFGLVPATVPVFHDTLSLVLLCMTPVAVGTPCSDLQSLFIPIFAHLRPITLLFHCFPPYTCTLMRPLWHLILARIVYIYAFFGYCTCLTFTFFIVPILLDSQHYHKVLQHLEVSC